MVYCFEGAPADATGQQKTAVGIRLHHSYGDGVALTCTLLPKVFNFIFANDRQHDRQESNAVSSENDSDRQSSSSRSECSATESDDGGSPGNEFVTVNLEASAEEKVDVERVPAEPSGAAGVDKAADLRRLQEQRATWFQELTLWIFGLMLGPYALYR